MPVKDRFGKSRDCKSKIASSGSVHRAVADRVVDQRVMASGLGRRDIQAQGIDYVTTMPNACLGLTSLDLPMAEPRRVGVLIAGDRHP